MLVVDGGPADNAGAHTADRLRDAPAVVTQQPVGGIDDAVGAAVVDFERMVAGAREEAGEVDQPGRVGAVVAVDRLVVVADAEHDQLGAGQQPDEEEVGGREILELVDQQHSTGPLRGASGHRVGEQHVDGAEYLLVEVDRPRPVEGEPVAREHRREAVDVAVVASLDHLRIDQTEPCEAECFDPRRDGIGVAPARERDERADDPAHLGFVDRGEPPWLRREGGHTVDDRECDGVERADLQTRQVSRAGSHLLLGPLVERHEADRGRRELPVREQVTSALGEHPGLARAGRCDDPGRAADVGNGGQLIGSEVGRGDVRAERGQRPVLERDPVHDDCPRRAVL